jgi:ABC-type transport system involved in multi-copper enzyme maturation permease subunit
MRAALLGGRILRELAFTAKGLAWLPAFTLLLSALVYLFLTNADLSLMDQETMIFMIAQAILLLGMLAVAIVGADAVAGERDRGTLEVLLAAPITRTQLLGGYLIGAVAPWAVMVLIALPYVAVMSAGTGEFAVITAYLVGTGTLLALGVAAWTVGLSARTDSLRSGMLTSLVVYAALAVPAVLSPALRGNWVGRTYDMLDPFSNVMNTLDSVIIDEQGLPLQTVRLLMLAAFSMSGLLYARYRLATLSLV